MTLEQLVRDILTQAIKDGLVAPTTEFADPDPQCRSSGELVGCANVVKDGFSGNLINVMAKWSSAERERFMDEYKEHFCTECGDDDPLCRCWDND